MISSRYNDIPEPFLTIEDAATKLGVFPWKMRRAARRGLVPTYRFFNRRRLVRLSEVLCVIEASRRGGRDE